MSEDRDRLLSNLPLTEQIERAKIELRADFAARIAAFSESLAARLDAMDKASVLLDANVTRVPTLLDRETLRIKELTDERFNGIQRQLVERDVRWDSDKAASQAAVVAALQAQKEAGTKSDTLTEKQLEALARRVDDLKERLDSGEGSQRGSVDTRQDQRAERNSSMQLVAIFMSAFAILVSIALAIIVLPHAAPYPVTVATPPAAAITPSR